MSTRQFQFAIEKSGRTTYEWFSPSASLRTEDDTDEEAAHLSAREWHDDASFIAVVRDNLGKPRIRIITL